MTDPKKKYEEALASFAVPGNRWSALLSLTYWAAASGLDTEQVLADAHGIGVRGRDGDIRRDMESARVRIGAYVSAQAMRPHPSGGRQAPYLRIEQPTPSASRVRQLMEAGKDVVTFGGLRALSPEGICSDRDWLARRVQCEQQLLALFSRQDLLHVFSPNAPTVGALGVNIRSLGDWLENDEGVHPDRTGEIVRPNPLTGDAGKTQGGKESYIAQSCIKELRHMVFEFDGMALEDQCRFWGGFVRRGCLPLVSLVYSGNKSIHGVIRVDAPDIGAWNRYREKVLCLFASDGDGRYRLDPQALHPLIGTRLAGAVRGSTGKIQELLWVRLEWRDGVYQRQLNGAAIRP